MDPLSLSQNPTSSKDVLQHGVERSHFLPTARTQKSFIHHHVSRASERMCLKEKHLPVVERFALALRSHPQRMIMFQEMFQQAKDSVVLNFEHLLHVLDTIVVSPPRYLIFKNSGGNWEGEPANVPMALAFDALCNSAAGCRLLSSSVFNAAMKDLLDAWGLFLTTPSSAATLTDDMEGWFGPVAMQDLTAEGRGAFNETYVCPDPSAVDRGFRSWDEFFTREIKEGARPVMDAADNAVIHNACESAVFQIATGVGCESRFSMKGNSYSLHDMLQDVDTANYFIGGTVYQAFLRPQDYHRWRSPVDGRVDRVRLIPGSYFEAMPGLEPTGKGTSPVIVRSLTWLTMVATRALVYIQADNEDIDLMVFIAVGMTEVSTCEVTVAEGQRVRAGEQLGMFHFGGSSYAMIFSGRAEIMFSRGVEVGRHIKVNDSLGRAKRRSAAL